MLGERARSEEKSYATHEELEWGPQENKRKFEVYMTRYSIEKDTMKSKQGREVTI